MMSFFGKSSPSAAYTKLNDALQALDKKATLVSEDEINRTLTAKKLDADHYHDTYAAFKLLTTPTGKTFGEKYEYHENDVLDPKDPLFHRIVGDWPNMNVSYAGIRLGPIEAEFNVTRFTNLKAFLKEYVLVSYYEQSGGKSRRRRRKKRVSRKNRRSRKR